MSGFKKNSVSDRIGLDLIECVDLKEATKVVGMPRVTTKVVDGRLVNDVEFVETPLEELNKGLTVNDFAIEVLLANGYEKTLLTNEAVGFADIDSVCENLNNVES